MRRANATRSWVCGLIAAVAMAWIVASVGAHNGEPPPGPPPRRDTVQVHPLRWSWVHWWEANRDAYLSRLGQTEIQPAEAEALVKLRERAVETLIKALGHPQPVVRAESALALGRIEATRAMDKLVELASRDPVEDVRLSAVLAIGLLADENSATRIREVDFATARLQLAGLVALGLLEQLPEETVDRLAPALRAHEPGTASLAAWTLHQTAAAGHEFFLEELRRTTEVKVASQVILGLDRGEQERSIRMLVDVVLATGAAPELPVWDRLMRRHERRLREVTANAQARANWRRSQQSNDGADDQEPRRGPDIRIGQELIDIARLRASAAIALARSERPEAAAALLTVLDDEASEYNRLVKSFAIMSLGELGAKEALPRLIELTADRPPPGRRATAPKRDSPLRGFAALALGLYARPQPTPQGLYDRPRSEVAVERLESLLANKRDTIEVRCAAAVALGVAQRTGALRSLQATSATLDTRHRDGDLLIGYFLLGRGMLGDRNVLEPARRFLVVANERTDLTGILSRRAAVLGLGMFGGREAVPILTEAWHLNHYVNREVIVALGLVGATAAGDVLLDELTGSDDPFVQAFMAKALGELFDPNRPARLARLVNASNFTVRDEARLPLQTIAREFLFEFLIPSFPEKWR